MTSLHRFTQGIGAAFALALAACSGEQGGGALFIESCSLGCSSGNSGSQVFCSVVNTAANQDFTVRFSEPIDPDSINAQSFRVTDTSNGTTPLGEVFVDSSDPSRVIFRPALTFDDAGNPIFGFAENTSYRFLIAGEAQDGNVPLVTSTSGRVNQSRLECTVLTDQGIIDPVEGNPSVSNITLTAVTATDNEGNPTAFEEISLQEANDTGAIIWRRSPIVVEFDEPMNPATLFNPLDGTSSSVLVELDQDGDVGTDADRLGISGRFDVDVDLEAGTTTLTFLHEVPNPDGTGFQDTTGFPSSGENPMNPRLVALTITPTVADILGLKVTDDPDGILFSFQPESIPQPALILPGGVVASGNPFESDGAESFDDDSIENQDRSGALWAGGRLQAGSGGGSGRLGEFFVAAGSTVTLSTDSDEVFPRGTNPANDLVFTPEELLDQQMNGTPAQITVSDGTFEFSRFVIETGGTLIFEGTNPARVFVRGPVSVPAGAIIDVSGGSAPVHDSRHPDPMVDWLNQAGTTTIAEAVTPGVAGPGGGQGGFGGARYRFANGVETEGGVNTTQLPMWVDGDTQGRAGGSVGAFMATSGQGGQRFPEGNYPDGTDFGDAQSVAVNQLFELFPDVFPGEDICAVRMVGGSGSGGGYALDGGDGSSTAIEAMFDFPAPADSNAPATGTSGGGQVPAFAAGQAEEPSFSNTGYDIRTLNASAGFLNGGSGGGGGGTHPFLTYYDGIQNFLVGSCSAANSKLADSQLMENAWVDHSGASGGGGGGALQLCSGSELQLDGVIDATGGDGGTNMASSTTDRPGAWAMPGGGGAGGAVLLQGLEVVLSPSPGRIDVTGGMGGVTTALAIGEAGDGSPGLVRIEDAVGSGADAAGADHDVYDQSIQPFDSGGAFGTFSVDFLSVAPGAFSGADTLPDSYSASVSCWIQPPGNFLNINFEEDPDANPDDDDPTDLGWNMHLIWDDAGSEVLVPFRGDAGGAIAANLLEIIRRNALNQDQPDATLRSPIAVRFQGASLAGELLEPCVTGLEPPISVLTLTPWVEHPAELNPGQGDPIPDVFRFAVFFDKSLVGNADLDAIDQNLLGVTNLWVRADPD